MLNRLALALAASTILAGAASAADLPMRRAAPVFTPVPVFTWTGFYVGVHAGYVASDSQIRTTGNQDLTRSNVANQFRPPLQNIDDEGFMGGGQVGFNYQINTLVLGIEADISYVDLDREVSFLSTTRPAGTPADPATFRQRLEYLGTVRGRLGLAFDRFMIFATGGLAYGDVSYQADFVQNTTGLLQFTGRRSSTEVGYTVGAGLEYAFTNNLTLKGEYLYFDLGRRDVTVQGVLGPATALSYNSNFETQGHIGRVGLNYKF